MSEKTRFDFEAWAASLGLCTEQRQGMYWFDNLETAWHCWLSSRRQALEEAAKKLNVPLEVLQDE